MSAQRRSLAILGMLLTLGCVTGCLAQPPTIDEISRPSTPINEMPVTMSATLPATAPITLPSVVDQLLSDAHKTLEQLGLKVSSEDSRESRSILMESNWIVTSQDPAPGTTMTSGETVTLGARKTSDPINPDAPTIPAGTWLVGIDIQPGTYRSRCEPTEEEVDICYWVRKAQDGSEIDGHVEIGSSQMTVVIDSSDYAFDSDGCEPWVRLD